MTSSARRLRASVVSVSEPPIWKPKLPPSTRIAAGADQFATGPDFGNDLAHELPHCRRARIAHALAQVASFTTESPIPAENLTKALNDILPPSIRVLEVTDAPPKFHARKSARAKTYRYRMLRSPICPPFLARYVWHYPYPLDENAMRQAAALVAGERDFTSFAAVDPEHGEQEDVSNVRHIFCSTWEQDGEEFIYTVRGSGFLHHMVRNLVGTFVLVGKGTLSPDDITRILEARNRSAAGATAPASGLYLVNVEY